MMKKKKRFEYFLLPVMILILTGFFLFSGQTTNGLDCNLLNGDDKNRCKELEKQSKVYKEMINIKKKQGETISDQISVLDTEIEKIGSQIDERKEEIKNINSEIEKISSQIYNQEALLEKQKRIMTNFLQIYYQNKKDDLLISLLSEKGVAFIISSEDKITQTEEKTKEMAADIKFLRDELEKERKELEEKRKKATDLFYDLEEKTTHVENTKDQKNVLLSQTKGEEIKYKTLLERVEEERKEIENEIENIELYKSSQIDYSSLPPVKKGYFTYPVNPVKITQGYGKTSFSSHYYSGKHNGVDFGIGVGSNIYAAKEGEVIGTGDNGKYAYGKWIAIDHGDGLVTLYGHLSKNLLSKGSSVKEGDKIALSGNTGFSTGPHLHFSVFASKSFDVEPSKSVKGINIPTGASLDPMRYLK